MPCVQSGVEAMIDAGAKERGTVDATALRPTHPTSSSLRFGTSARAHLKAATDPVHERLDADLSAFDLADFVQYGRFLVIHAMALPPLEEALAAGDRIGFRTRCPDWAGGARTRALRDDLMGLGLSPPRPLAVADADDVEAWGVAYVLEGSRLGGRVLARRAAAGSHPQVVANMRFLTASPTMPWQGFLALMETALRTPEDRHRAVAGARTAFGAFDEALGRVQVGQGCSGFPLGAIRTRMKTGPDRSDASERSTAHTATARVVNGEDTA